MKILLEGKRRLLKINNNLKTTDEKYGSLKSETVDKNTLHKSIILFKIPLFQY